MTFTNPSPGDAFRTRDGRKAVYKHQGGVSTHTLRLGCDTIIYIKNGLVGRNLGPSNDDIIGPWVEPEAETWSAWEECSVLDCHSDWFDGCECQSWRAFGRPNRHRILLPPTTTIDGQQFRVSERDADGKPVAYRRVE